MTRAHQEPTPSDSFTGAVPTPRGSGATASGGTPGARPGTDAPERSLTSRIALGVIALVCVIGVFILIADMVGISLVFPATAVAALVLCALTLLFGYWLLRRVRPVRAPGTRVSLTAVAWGFFGATGLALYTNLAILSLIEGSTLSENAAGWSGVVLAGPVTEEFFKLVGIVLIALAFTRALRGPMEGFVIGALVGLGFQVSENLDFAIKAVIDSGGVNGVGAAIGTVLLRVVLTGLGTHWALSALTGTAVGLMVANAWRLRGWRVPAAGLLVLAAVLMHTFINAPVLVDGLWLGGKALINFAIVMCVYFVLRRVYRRRLLAALADEGGGIGMDSAATAALARRGSRRKSLRAAPRSDRATVAEFQERMIDAAEDRALTARD